MLECPNLEMRDRLPDLANESLESSVRALVLAHIEECAACAVEIEIIRSTRLIMINATPRVNVANIAMALPTYESLPRAERGVRALPQHGVVPIHSARSARGRTWGNSWRIAAAATFLAAGFGSYAVLRPDSPVRTNDTIGIATRPIESAGLALTGTLADLSDDELSALVKDIEGMEALPSTDVENGGLVGVPILPDTVVRNLEIQ